PSRPGGAKLEPMRVVPPRGLLHGMSRRPVRSAPARLGDLEPLQGAPHARRPDVPALPPASGGRTMRLTGRAGITASIFGRRAAGTALGGVLTTGGAASRRACRRGSSPRMPPIFGSTISAPGPRLFTLALATGTLALAACNEPAPRASTPDAGKAFTLEPPP